MARLRADYIAFARRQLDELAQTTFTEFDEADLPEILSDAVALFSDDQPRILASVLDSDNDVATPVGGSQEWILTPTGADTDLFPGWSNGFSEVKAIESAYDSDRPYYLRAEDYTIRTAPMAARGGTIGQRLRVYYSTEGVTSTKFCVFYTTPHTVDDNESTVPLADEVALGYLFCNHICIAVAGRLRRTADKRTGAAGIDFSKSKADEYISQAKVFYENYRRHLGLPEKGPVPVSVTTSVPTGRAWSGYGHLTHGR